jgi:hypothetical protein
VKQNSEKSPFRSKLGTYTPPGQWHDTASFSSSARTSKEDFVTSGAGFWDFGGSMVMISDDGIWR